MSNNKTPSLVALLGLLAVAGYQNRDKISDMIRKNRDDGNPDPRGARSPSQPGFLEEIGSLFGGAGGGAALSDAVTGLLDRFKGAGQPQVADSWLSTGTNKRVNSQEIEASLGDEIVQALTEKTGLSRTEILSRLSRALPEAVDGMTPNGRIPSANEAQSYI